MIDFSNDFIQYYGLSRPPSVSLSSFYYKGSPYLITLGDHSPTIHSIHSIHASIKGDSLLLNIHYVSHTLTHTVVSTLNSIPLIDLLPVSDTALCQPTLNIIHIVDIFSYLLDPYHIYCYFFLVVT